MQNALEKLNYFSKEKQWKALVRLVDGLDLGDDAEHLQIYLKKPKL